MLRLLTREGKKEGEKRKNAVEPGSLSKWTGYYMAVIAGEWLNVRAASALAPAGKRRKAREETVAKAASPSASQLCLLPKAAALPLPFE